MTHNFRPIQPLNNRIVLANSPHSDEPEYRPIFIDPLPATDPPATTDGSNIMDLTSTEQDTTLHYEVTDWSTTIKLVAAPVQPATTTPKSTDAPVTTHKTHKLDRFKNRGQDSGSQAVLKASLWSVAVSTLTLVIASNLLH